MNFIDKIKNKMKERETKALERDASELASLRRERLRLTGVQKIKNIRDQEKKQISDIKKDLFNRTATGKTVSFLKERFEEVKKQRTTPTRRTTTRVEEVKKKKEFKFQL